jgi:hypothetical protein
MSKLNIEELLGGLLEAAMVAQGISEKQHINSLANYFDNGVPKTIDFKVGEKTVTVPLYILADHSSIGLSELDIEFETRLVFGNTDDPVSKVKQSILGLFRKKGYKHNLGGIEVDSGATNTNNSGMAKIKVKFTSDDKPEAVSRLVDQYIQRMIATDNKTA